MAQKGVNKVIVMGNLGQDPELRYSNNGTAFCNLSVATSESWKDKNTGEQREETEWHRVTLSGKLAEIAAEYLRKGSQVYVEGKLKTRKWQDQSGADRYSTEINVGVTGVMQLIGGKPAGDAPAHSGQQQQKPQQQRQQKPQQAQQPAPDFDDDIPW